MRAGDDLVAHGKRMGSFVLDPLRCRAVLDATIRVVDLPNEADFRHRTTVRLRVGVQLMQPLVAPDGITALPVCYRERRLHAVLCESLKQTKELLNRLELRGVQVARAEQREVVRLLYVATRHQVKALAATLELEGLE